MYHKGVVFQCIIIFPCDLCPEQRAQCTVQVADIDTDLFLLLLCQCFFHFRNDHGFIDGLIQLEIENVFRHEVHLDIAFFLGIGIGEDIRHIDLALVCACRILLLYQQIRTSHQFIYSVDSQLRHVFPHFLCHKPHEVDDIFRLAAETFPQFRILCGNAYRTGIQIADTHHHAAHCYQRSRCEAVFFCTQHCGNDHVTSAHHFSVCLNDNLRTQIVLDQRLVCFCQTQFPRQTCIVNGAARSRTGTAVITGNQDDSCTSLGNAGCNGADTGFRNQLHGDTSLFVGIFQVVDQLCQIFDRVNIVVRRR